MPNKNQGKKKGAYTRAQDPRSPQISLCEDDRGCQKRKPLWQKAQRSKQGAMVWPTSQDAANMRKKWSGDRRELKHLNQKHFETVWVIFNSLAGFAPLSYSLGFQHNQERGWIQLSLTRGKGLPSHTDHQVTEFLFLFLRVWLLFRKSSHWKKIGALTWSYYIKGTKWDMSKGLFFFLTKCNTLKRKKWLKMWESRKRSLRNEIL